MSRLAAGLVVVFLGVGCHEKVRPEPPPPAAVRVEAVTGAAPATLQRCSLAGDGCQAVGAGARIELPARLETAGGARATLRVDTETTVALDLESVLVAPDASTDRLEVPKGRCSFERGPGATDLEVVAAESQLELIGNSPTRLAIAADDPRAATATLHRGEATLVGADGTLELGRGQTVRLEAGSAADLGAAYAGRASPIAVVRVAETGAPAEEVAARGFGRVSARVPGTEQVVTGVRIRRHQVRAVLQDGFARTEVEEELFNDTGRVLEGRFVFALPSGASLSRLALWVGDQLIEGEIVERGRAAGIFRGIVDETVRPRDPALLEWVSGSEVSLKIFPIAAHDGRRVILAYDEALPADGGALRYRYPLELGRDRATQIDDFSIRVTARALAAGDTNAALRTPGYATSVTEKEGSAEVAFAAQRFRPDADFVVEVPVAVGAPRFASSATAPAGAASPGDDPRYFALPVRAELPAGTDPPPSTPLDRVVVVDRSFSQGDDSLAAQVRVARAALEELASSEHFAVLACDATCDAYPPQGLVAATPHALAAAETWLDSAAKARGASDLAGAVLAGARHLEGDGRGQLVVLGDGRATAGELTAASISERIGPVVRAQRVELRLLGVGRTVDEVLLTGLATAVGATYEAVAGEGALAERIDALALALRAPVVEAPVLELPPSCTELYPARLPNLRLGQEVLVLGKLGATEAGRFSLRGTLSGRPYRLERALARGAVARPNPLLPRLWAERRIAALEASGAADVDAEILGLSRRHHVLSRRTSLLVLENERMFAEFGIERTEREQARERELASAWGGATEDAAKGSGLGLDGLGEGGGGGGQGLSGPGLSELGLGGLGLSGNGTLGHGAAGNGEGIGFGSGSGRLGGSHTTRAPRIRLGASTVSGRLPPEVIQRIVRQNYGRFRVCFEQGLARNPVLAGRVAVRFVIGRDGRVLHAADGGSDLPDSAVVGCVVKAVYDLSFPQPEGGIVTVMYPLMFATDGAASPAPRAGNMSPPPFGNGLAPAQHHAGSEAWRAAGESEIEAVRDGIEQNPASRRAWSELLSTLLRRGRFAEARSEGSELVRRDPDDASAHERLAWALAALGDGGAAALELAAAAELEPRRAARQLAAARAFEGVGDEARACAHWRAAAALESTPGDARREAVRCRARLGDLAAARAEITTLPTDGRFAPLRAALAAGEAPAHDSVAGAPGWFEARVTCDDAKARCPEPVIVTPRGRVVSAWSPERARAGAGRAALARSSTGRYRTLLVGGDRGVHGKLTMVVHGATHTRSFVHAGGVETALESDVFE